MADRAQYRDAVISPTGDAIVASVEVRDAGTAVPIAEAIYVDSTGGALLSNPFPTDQAGRFQFYLANPKRVDLYIQASGYAAYTVEDVDVLRITEGASPAYLIAAANAPDETKLRAEYLCDGVHDEIEFALAQAALGSRGGTLRLSRGDYYFGATFLIGSMVTLEGEGIGITMIHLADGVNADVIQSASFLALTGTDSTLGEHHVVLRGFTVDGNKVNNTAGYCLRRYGYFWRLECVSFRYGKSGGIWSEWGLFAGNLPNGDGMEDSWSDVRVHACDGDGVEWRGPHDSIWQDVIIFNNKGSALIVRCGATYSGGPLQVTNLHVWSNNTLGPAIWLSGTNANMFASNIQVEGSHTGVGIRCEATLHVTSFVGFANAIDIQVLKSDCIIEGSFVSPIGIQFGSPSIAVGGIMLRGKFLGPTTCILWENSSNQFNYLDVQAYVGGGKAVMGGAGTFSPTTNVLIIAQGGPGTLFRIENKGVQAGATDGSTITHGLAKLPSGVIVTTSVAGEFASVTARAATTFTVAIKKHDGTPGTAQNIYWRAWV